MSKDKDDGVLIISKEVYCALSPLEQIAAQALEKVGKVKIVDGDQDLHADN